MARKDITMSVWIGIDITKHTLECAESGRTTTWQVPNTAAGWAALRSRYATCPPDEFVMEATGSLSVGVHLHLTASGFASTVLTPAWSHHFAGSEGCSKKTDRTDAQLLARYGAEKQPIPTPVKSPHQRRLTALIQRRAQRVTLQVMEQNRRTGALPDDPVDSIDAVLAVVQEQIAALNAQIEEVVAADVAMQTRAHQMRSMPGIGPVVRTWLPSCLPELGDLDRRAIAALAGVAPHPRERGGGKTRRAIRGGRPEIRRALSMAAQTAAHHGPYFKEYFFRDMGRPGKEYTMGAIAVANKMLTIRSAMVRDGLMWEDTRAYQSTCSHT